MTSTNLLNPLTRLRDALVRSFDDGELAVLCQDIGVDRDELKGDTKTGRAAALLNYLERRGELDKLIGALERVRVNVPWRVLLQSDQTEVADAQTPSPAPDKAQPPFRGLEAFRVADAGIYFGREQLAASLIRRLHKTDFLAIVGASGSGKSSLALAGMVATLQGHKPLAEGALPDGSRDWAIHIITPKVHPLAELAKTLTPIGEGASPADRLVWMDAVSKLTEAFKRDETALDFYVNAVLANTPAKRMLLVVDQFEELFTLSDESERDAFVENLLRAVSGNAPGALVVILTLRADFYERCARYGRLRQLLETNQAYIGPLSEEELRRTMEEPARRAGLQFEPGLVDALVEDVNAQPGALPLLSHALLETWKRRRETLLTHQGYRESGRVAGAIARTADEVYDAFSPERQAIARRTFLRLITLGEGAEDTRRRAAYDELIGGQPGEAPLVDDVLQRLAGARLITTDTSGTSDNPTSHETFVEVAHEALIGCWARLQTWLDESRDGLRIQRQLGAAALEWQKAGRDPDALQRGAKLAQAGEWAAAYPDDLSAGEREFLAASQAEAQRLRDEREAQQRVLANTAKHLAEVAAHLQRSRMYLVAVTVVALLAALGALLSAIQSRVKEAEAQRQTAIARARELMTRAQVEYEANPLLGMRLAIEAMALLPKDSAAEGKQLEETLAKLTGQGRVLKQKGKLSSLITTTVGGVEESHVRIDSPRATSLWVRLSQSILNMPNKVIFLSGEVDNWQFSGDGKWVWISYADAGKPREVRSLSAPDKAISLLSKIDYWRFSGDGKWVWIRYAEAGKLWELRSLNAPDNVIPLSGKVADWHFDDNWKWVLVNYAEADKLGEVRLLSDPDKAIPIPGNTELFLSTDQKWVWLRFLAADKLGEVRLLNAPDKVILLSSKVDNWHFSDDGKWILIAYAEIDKPWELRLRDAPDKSITLSGKVDTWRFSSDGKWVWIHYAEAGKPWELRLLSAPHKVIPLSGNMQTWRFSNDGNWVWIRYDEADKPWEVRSLSAPDKAIPLVGTISDFWFSNDGEWVWIGDAGADKPRELRLLSAPNKVIPLSGKVDSWQFGDDGKSVLIEYAEADKPSELRSLNEPDKAIPLSGKVDAWHFSDDGEWVWIRYAEADKSEADKSGEVRSLNASQKTIPLSGKVDNWWFSDDGKLAWIHYAGKDNPDEVRLLSTPDKVIPLNGSVYSELIASPNLISLNERILAMAYTDYPAEIVWLKPEGSTFNPITLLTLDLGVDKFLFDASSRWLFVHYADGRVYLLDLEWLKALHPAGRTLSTQEIITLSCARIKASGLFNEAELTPFLRGEPARACQ